MGALTGVILAMLPRRIRWKMSLYASRQLLVMGTVVHYAFCMGTLEPVYSFVFDNCGPFLAAFWAYELCRRSPPLVPLKGHA